MGGFCLWSQTSSSSMRDSWAVAALRLPLAGLCYFEIGINRTLPSCDRQGGAVSTWSADEVTSSEGRQLVWGGSGDRSKGPDVTGLQSGQCGEHSESCIPGPAPLLRV